MGIKWAAVSAIGTIFLGITAILPIGLGCYRNHKRRAFHKKQLNAQLTVLQKKLQEVIDKKSWGSFTKIPFEKTNKVNFQAIEFLFGSSGVLSPREQDFLRDFCVFMKPFKNMKTQHQFDEIEKRTEEILVSIPDQLKVPFTKKV